MDQWELWNFEDNPDGTFTVFAAPKDADALPHLSAEMTVRLNDGKIELLALTLHKQGMRNSDLCPVTPKEVREFPLVQLLNQAEIALSCDSQNDLDDSAVNYAALRKEWPKGDVDKVCKAVADLYHHAATINIGRQEVIEAAFEVSKATAGRMIAKARELGYIHVSSAVGRPKKQGKQHGTPETKSQ